MEQITIGEAAVALTFIVGLISGALYLRTNLQKWVRSAVKPQMDEIGDKVESLKQDVRRVDLEACKNYLVIVLSEIERGKDLDEIERARFWEQYQHYTSSGGNTYIKRRVEQYIDSGKI